LSYSTLCAVADLDNFHREYSRHGHDGRSRSFQRNLRFIWRDVCRGLVTGYCSLLGHEVSTATVLCENGSGQVWVEVEGGQQRRFGR
jgi:hypothetical protein